MQRHDQLHRFIVIAVGTLIILCGYILYTAFFQFTPKQLTLLPPSASTKDISSFQKTKEQRIAYTVPPDHPRELIINKLGIDANILPVGLRKASSIDTPRTAWDVGWYTGSALPGIGTTALVIDGHVNDALNQPGIFYRLNSLQTGDQIEVERGDKQRFTYIVAEVEQKPIDTIDTTTILRSAAPGKQGLNLITCSGVYNYKQQTYNDRIIVYAQLKL